jgi:hypothetical protein
MRVAVEGNLRDFLLEQAGVSYPGTYLGTYSGVYQLSVAGLELEVCVPVPPILVTTWVCRMMRRGFAHGT